MTLINKTDRIEDAQVEKSLDICAEIAKINKEQFGDKKLGY